MNKSTLLKKGTIINEGLSFEGSLLIRDERIEKIIRVKDYDSAEIYSGIISGIEKEAGETIDCSNLHIFPGIIDDHVHFREPGNTWKADIESESRAAVLGGVTSFMDMPNNTPPSTTIERLENKYRIGEAKSFANYSFYLGAANDNIKEIRKINPEEICGIKVFMGSSTGNMLVDDPQTLEDIFKYSPTLIAAHCEDEKIIGKNMKAAIAKYGENIPAEAHDSIRSRQACIKSSEKAIGLAEKYGSELHILHISTKEEIEMLRRAALINDKITGEICVHYLIFNRNDYKTYGNKIKCNPALKDEEDMMALRKALKDRTIRVLGTDHAPHLKSEKDRTYKQAPGGLPLIRHSFQIMLELAEKGIFTLGEIADSMSHAPADVFKIKDRGYVREGYYADLVVADLRKKDSESTIKPPYKCGWSPLEGKVFGSSVIHTLVNGTVVVKDGAITGLKNSKRLMFKR